MARVVFTDELIEGFYQEIKDKYPHISRKNIDRICRAEFQMMKEVMQSGTLESMRLQYLFVLRVSPQRIIKQLTYMKENKEEIRFERFNHYLELIVNYINRTETKLGKHEHRIKELTDILQTFREQRTRENIGYGYSSPTN